MTPFWQIVLGDLLSILMLFLVIVFSAKFISKFRYDLLLIVFGYFCLAIPAFVIGDFGFVFSKIVLKNIFLVALYESLMIFIVSICAVFLGAIIFSDPFEKDGDDGGATFIILLVALIALTVIMGISFNRNITEEYREYDFDITTTETTYDVSKMQDSSTYYYVHEDNYNDSYYLVFYINGEEIKPINIPMHRMRIILSEENDDKAYLTVIKETRIKVCENDSSYVPEKSIDYYYRLILPKDYSSGVSILEGSGIAEVRAVLAS